VRSLRQRRSPREPERARGVQALLGMHPRAATQRRADWVELGRQIKHIDPDALRILANWVAKQMAESGRGPLIERDFVVVG
jgi:hypothetical protein